MKAIKLLFMVVLSVSSITYVSTASAVSLTPDDMIGVSWNCMSESKEEGASWKDDYDITYVRNGRFNEIGSIDVLWSEDSQEVSYFYSNTGTWKIDGDYLIKVTENANILNVTGMVPEGVPDLKEMIQGTTNFSESYEVIEISKTSLTLKEESEDQPIVCSRNIEMPVDGSYSVVGINADGSEYQGVAVLKTTDDLKKIEWYIAGEKNSCTFTKRGHLLVHKDCDYDELSYIVTQDRIIGTWDKGKGLEELTLGVPEIELTYYAQDGQVQWNGEVTDGELTLLYDWDPVHFDSKGCLLINGSDVSGVFPDGRVEVAGELELCSGITEYSYDLASELTQTEPIKEGPTISIKLAKSSGVYEIPVVLNDVLTIDFVMDTGAADVTITPDVFATLLRTGTLKSSHMRGKETFVIADGSEIEQRTFIISKVSIGGRMLKDVSASVTDSLDSPMLLGQSALKKLGKYSVDYDQGILIIE